VGKKGIKWCFSENCAMTSHKESKSLVMQESFYIKEKSTSGHALCAPCVPDPYLHIGEILVQQWLDAFDPKIVAEWEMEFAVVNNRIKANLKSETENISKEDWEVEWTHQAEAANKFKTPRKGTFTTSGTTAGTFIDKLAEAVDLMGVATKMAMAKLLRVATLVGESVQGASHSNLYVELSEVQELVVKWEERGTRIETKIVELESKAVDTSSCVSKNVFEAVQTQISSLFKLLLSKQGDITTTIIDLNKMIIEVNKRVEQAAHAGNIAPQASTFIGRTASTSPTGEFDELLKLAHKDSVWTDGKTKHSKEIGEKDGSDNSKRIKELEDDVARLIKSVDHVLHKEDSKAIDIGRTSFGGEDDVEIWVEKCLPPTNPFGYFVDIYSFLNRILASNNGIGSLGDLVTNLRLEVSSDEAVSIADSYKNYQCYLARVLPLIRPQLRLQVSVLIFQH